MLQQLGDGRLRGRQIAHVLGLEGGQLHHAFDVAGEFFQLLAHVGHGLLVKPLMAVGFGDEVKRFRLDFLSTPIEGAGQRPGR